MAKKAASKRSPSKKKTTKAPSSKKTSTKKAGSKAPARKAPTKRTTSKKAPTKKVTSKKTTSKKSPTKKTTKKTTSKKAPARKPSKKASTTKKTTTKKSTAKKPAAKKPTSKKSTTKKPVTKKTTTKKATERKPSAKPAANTSASTGSKKTPTRKTSAKKSPSKAKSDSKSIKEKWKGSYSSDMTSSVSAASRLAAAAGLRPLHERQTATAATEDYKRLTKTPYKKRELDKFKDILRLKRAQVTGDVNDMETEALVGRGSGSLSKLPQHMADAGSDTYDQTLNLDLAAEQRRLLKEIDDALTRIENKTYGICEILGKPISKERLENTPWARYSIEAARRKEMLGY